MKDRGKDVVWCDRGWQPVYIGFCPTAKAWHRQMKTWGRKKRDNPFPKTAGSCSRFNNDDGSVAIIITVQDGAENKYSLAEIVGILTHEAAHVWQFILKHIGEKRPSPEFEAYSMQAITQELFEAMDKTRGPLGAKDRK